MFSSTPQLKLRKQSDLLVVPFWEGSKKPEPAAPLESLQLKSALDSGDFHGKHGETTLLYSKSSKEQRVLLLGLGKKEKVAVENLRLAHAEVVKLCQKMQLTKVSLVVPDIADLPKLTVSECLTGICEGILLTNYQWKQSAKPKKKLLQHVQLIGVSPKEMSVVKETELIAEGVYFTRDLINGDAHTVTPAYLVKTAENIAKQFPAVKATIFDKKRIAKEQMGLLQAVAAGGPHDPAFIILKYEGQPQSKDHTVVVGKGVTYDTGGLDLKTAAGMLTMRDDMSGAATALGTVATAASLKLKINVTAVVPTTENAIDAHSFKPGDVYTSLSGTTVEIGNTDAEGRLILADALTYSVKKLAPTRIIDFATLTGAMVVALGYDLAGLFSNNDKLAKELLVASEKCAEPLWRFPLHAPYKKQLESDIADLCNIGGRAGGSIVAALFLEHFLTKSVPWAHIDLSTAFQNKASGYWPKNGVGFGVRLMIDFLRSLPSAT